MKRKIESRLLKWKESPSRLPLIVQGARQVGKTFAITNFGKDHYKNTVYLNFESHPDIARIFEQDLSPERIIREISIFSASSIFEHDTLLFFDEVQTCEKALTSLKYFAEQAPDYHIIAAGSLLGVAINRNEFSYPVGKVEHMTLYPMDFEEYLWAIDQRDAVSVIRESFADNRPTGIHKVLLKYHEQFMFTGGMPGVLEKYIDSGDPASVQVQQKSINNAYIADMAKYASAWETVKIMAVYDSIPKQLAKENKKFQYKVIKTGARASDYANPLDWLRSAGLIIKCEKVNEGEFPLIAGADAGHFKIYLSDTGILCSRYGVPPHLFFSGMSDLHKIKGILAENHVAAALVANGFTPYYWESKGIAEVDFVIQDRDGDVIPIEVKSSDHVRSKSLQQFVKSYEPKYAIRVSTKDFGFENGIRAVPLYAVFCLGATGP
ncbi:MAG: ATP-binding protein [Bacteroidota bacterium]|nr:ATP-binding protein [Bacteroidota bacterium]